MALAGLLVLLSQAGTLSAVLVAANRDAISRAERELIGAGTTAQKLARGRSNRLNVAGIVLAADPYFRNAISSRDAAATATILAAERSRANLDLGMLLDARGRVITASGPVLPQGIGFPGLVARAQRPGPSRAVIRANDQTIEVVTVPVGDDEPMAWLAVGLLVDDALARSISELTGLDATLLNRVQSVESVLGSSLPHTDATALLSGLMIRSAPDGTPMAFTSDGIEQLALVVPLIPGDAEVEVLLSEHVEAAMASFEAMRLWIILLSFAVMCLAMAGGMMLSRTISEPVRALVRAAQRIRDGDYSQPVDVEADGDVAVLGSALNTMQEGIAEREERILYQARFDALTALPTRLSAMERLEATITAAVRRDEPVTVLLIDLNNVSEAGSSLGQDIGDALRCQAAERLRGGLDAAHMLARLEGDQFLAILDRHDVDQAREIADELLRLLSAGLSVRDVNVSVDACIGIATCPQHARDAEQLLMHAAIARSEARNTESPVLAYQPGNEQRHVRQLAILADIRRAARHDEFRLFLQPRIRLSDGAVCGAEALVRWQHPVFGFLTPDQFIPVAEKSGNIAAITHWALAAAIRECRLWLEDGLDLPVSVNLSGRDLQNRDLPCFALELLRDHDLAPRNLVVEITEQAVIIDPERATLVLECLRDLGVRISIDDFGTGYSSLAQLKHLPADELKIDRSFVRDLPGNKDDAAIVRAAIDLAHNLGLEVVAEGVESSAAVHWLKDRGCEHAQGFLISKPMPAEEFCAWVRRYQQVAAWPPGGLRIAS